MKKMKNVNGWMLGIMAATAIAATPQTVHADSPLEVIGKNPAAWTAAQALFGEGLTIKATPDKVEIAWGKLNATTLATYASEIYLPLVQARPALFSGGDLRERPGVHRTPSKPQAFWLLEPMRKLDLCTEIAKAIERQTKVDDATHQDRLGYCLYKAMVEANSPLFGFHGQPVSYPGGRDAGLPSPDAPAWKGVLVTVTNPSVTIDGGREIALAKEIWNLLQQNPSPWRTKGQAIIGGAEARHAKRVKNAPAEQKRILGSKAILFADTGTDYEIAAQAARPGASCQALSYIVRPPGKSKSKDGFRLEIRVDGTMCVEPSVAAGINRSVLSCEGLNTAGEHQLEAKLFQNVNKVGGTRIKPGTVNKKEKYYVNTNGPLLATETFACDNGAGAGN
jgi:hypothetical protein